MLFLSGSAAANGLPQFSERDRQVIDILSGPGEMPRDATNAVADDPAAVRLGRDLFFDPRLSGTNAWSCASCHQPARGWSDGEAVPSRFPGVGRNSQSLWDVGFDVRFFWDGRATTLWRQALSPIESPAEMQGHRLKIAVLVYQDVQLRHDYESLFGRLDPALVAWLGARFRQNMTLRNRQDWQNVYRLAGPGTKSGIDTVFHDIAKCLAAFERRLIAGRSRFDRYAQELAAAGRSTVLSAPEQRGLALFIGKAGCVQCHSGPAFSDGALHQVHAGRPSAAPSAEADRGRQWIKTPRLRNVALSAPYMHDGRLATLREVVDYFADRAYSSSPATRGLTAVERAELAGFLETLTDSALTRRDPGGLYAVEQFLRRAQ